jgi:streptogramin lyase
LSLKYTSTLGVLLLASLVLSGCGVGTVDHSSSGTLAIRGMVHGGQQPVEGSSIQLYTVGSKGIGSAATAMLTKAVTSDGQGNFNSDTAYTCNESSTGMTIPAGSDQVYIVASGGNPGLSQGTDNKALVMVAALGSCSNLPNQSYVEINELTTVAAAWALAPFMMSSTQVGATSTNPDGIQNAFLDAGLLVDTTTGQPATLPTTMSIETEKLIALADAIASCVNTDGGSGCTPLFTAATPSGGTMPTDTLTAALNIVKYPGQNVAAVFKAIGDFPAFVTSLQEAPNDWTMSLTITEGGLNSPQSLAIDKESNVWVANEPGPLSAFGPQGSPLSVKGYAEGTIAQVDAVVVDSAGDVWVTNFNGGSGTTKGSVTEFAGSDAVTPAMPGTSLGEYSNGIFFPDALSADTIGNVFIADHDSSSVTEYNSSGGLVASGLGSNANLNAHPEALAVDADDGFWMSDNDSTIAHISAPSTNYPNGQLLSHPICCAQSYGLATDSDGAVWVADYLGGTNFDGAFAEVLSGSTNNLPISDSTVGGINHPAFVVVDAAQNVWISNYRGSSITEIAGNHTNVPGGTALSPTTGTYGKGGFGLDAALDGPLGIALDRAGNVWVSNQGANTVTMFFGLAAPTVTPVQPSPKEALRRSVISCAQGSSVDRATV